MGEGSKEVPPFLDTEMRRSTYRKLDYLQAGQLFHWATRDHYVMWFTGGIDRHKRTEKLLPQLVAEGKLVRRIVGGRHVYAVPRRCKVKLPDYGYEVPAKYREELENRYLQIEHGLACTEGMVRFWRSRRSCEIIPEHYFKGLGSIPDWGMRYPNGSLLLYEFCSKDNFYRTHNVRNKVEKYREVLPAIKDRFAGNGTIVLFVLDVPRETVQSFVNYWRPTGSEFFFTDYETFQRVPIGHQLSAPVYLWGEDGKAYAIGKDDEP